MRDRAIQAVNQGIVITVPNLRDNPIVYVSPGFERMTGYASAEVVGRNCRLLQGKDTDRTEVARIAAAVQGGVSHSGEVLNYRKDGSTFWKYQVPGTMPVSLKCPAPCPCPVERSGRFELCYRLEP